MATQAQITANQQNAQHSTGATSEAGKAASCLNNFRHGFCGAFTVLPSEDQGEYEILFRGLKSEHRPETATESILIEKMAQHLWLSKRAQILQDLSMDNDLEMRKQERRFALFLRYQTTNDRGFHKCLNDLLKLRAEKRRAQIGFESQKQKQAAELRREAGEKRNQELHGRAVLLAEAKTAHQLLLNQALEHSKNPSAQAA